MKKMNIAKLILSSSFVVACGGSPGGDSKAPPVKGPDTPPPPSFAPSRSPSLHKAPSEVASSRDSSVSTSSSDLDPSDRDASLDKPAVDQEPSLSITKKNTGIAESPSAKIPSPQEHVEKEGSAASTAPSESKDPSESSHSSTDASEVPSPLPAGEKPKSILRKGDRKSPDDTRTSPRKRMKNIAERSNTPLNTRKAFGKKISAAEMAERVARANALRKLEPSPSASSSLQESQASTPFASPSRSPSPKRLAGNHGAITQRTLRESDAQSGSVDLGEISSHYSLNMPLHIKVSAASNHLEARDKNASLFYRSGNALLGVSHVFTNTPNPLSDHDSQKETSVVAACMTGPGFLELQAGTMSKHSLHDANWSGSQQILTVGYDCTSGITPFVQLAARQLLEDKITHHQEHSAYVGFLLDAERKNGFYTSKSRVALKTGMVSDRHESTLNAKAEHFLSVEHGLKLDTISFNTSLELSTKDSAQVNMSIGFSL